MTRLREFLGALAVFFDLLCFAAFLGAVVGVFFFFAKTIANMAP